MYNNCSSNQNNSYWRFFIIWSKYLWKNITRRKLTADYEPFKNNFLRKSFILKNTMICSCLQLFLLPVAVVRVRTAPHAQTSLWIHTLVPVPTTSLEPTVMQVTILSQIRRWLFQMLVIYAHSVIHCNIWQLKL